MTKRTRPPYSNPGMPGGRAPPAIVVAALQRANTLHGSGQLEEAERLYREVLRLQPNNFDARHRVGVIGLQTGRVEQAVEFISHALRIMPSDPQAHANLGSALIYANRPEEALRHYDRALRLDPRFAGVLNNRGNVLQTLNRHDEAAESFHKLLKLAPDFEFALGNCFQSRRMGCDWRDFPQQQQRILAALSSGERVERPFSLFSVSGSAERQLQCARIYAAYLCPTPHAPLWKGEDYRHDRIRVAYVSADFRTHVVANLMASIYERHDRSRFHTVGISLAAADESEIVARAKAALDQFVDVSGMSDESAAKLLRELEIDVAVDLTGFTQGCRPGIFARRPAPVHVNFLGFPGTLGVTYMDYIIADDFVIPPASEASYSERVARLPDCFQANDERRSTLALPPTQSRREAGLPENGVVFCSFNNAYKLNPAAFDLWMHILKRVPDSVLWVVAGEPTQHQRLSSEAAARGVEPSRLVFAPRVPYPEHLARLKLADLFLDSLPFNAGATASDALWAGVPVLTCAGEAFASRMAGSLLRAAGLPDLITLDTDEYVRRAIELASSPAELMDIKARLVANRDSCSLFNTERYCRHLEQAYVQMCERVSRGEPPASFSVTPQAGTARTTY